MENKQWYRLKNTDKSLTYERKGASITNPVQEKIHFSDVVVEAFSLETKHAVPFDHNFTSIPNYFLDYWAYVLGMKAAYTYIRYVRHVYKSGFEPTKNITHMAKLMGISKNTLKEYISILEEYGFIAVFYKDIQVEKSRIETQVRIKVRKTIPFLTPDLLKKLPLELQKYHAKDIAELEKTASVTFDKIKSVDEIFGIEQYDLKISTGDQKITPDILSGGQKFTSGISTGGQISTPDNTVKNIHRGSNTDPAPSQILTPPENTLSEFNLNINNNELWLRILDRLRSCVSTRALVQFSTSIKVFKKYESLIFSSSNSFAISWIEEKYGKYIKQIVHDLDRSVQEIRYELKEC